jgi:hypothetical protein
VTGVEPPAEVDDEAYRQCAHETLQLYAAADGQLKVPVEGAVKFRATFPIAMYALNQVYAASLLTEKDREYLAVANVRVAYEHAVTAQWVLFRWCGGEARRFSQPTQSNCSSGVGQSHRHPRRALVGLRR